MRSPSRSSHTTFVPGRKPVAVAQGLGDRDLSLPIDGGHHRHQARTGRPTECFATATTDCDQSRRSPRRFSEVQQEPECPRDGEERFIVRSTKTRDEPVL